MMVCVYDFEVRLRDGKMNKSKRTFQKEQKKIGKIIERGSGKKYTKKTIHREQHKKNEME